MRSTALPSGPVVDLAALREALTTTTDVGGLAVPGYAFAIVGLSVLTVLLLAMVLRRRAARRAGAATSDPTPDMAVEPEANAASPLVHTPQTHPSSAAAFEPGLAQHPTPETIPPVGPVFAGPGSDLPGTLSAPETLTPTSEASDPWMELQERSATYLTGGPASNPDLVVHPISGETSQRRRRGTPDHDAVPVARQGSRPGHDDEELTHEPSVDEVLIPDLPPGSHTRPDTADWLTEEAVEHDTSEVAEQAQAWLESLTLEDTAAQDTDQRALRATRAAPPAPEPAVQTHTTTWTPPDQSDFPVEESDDSSDNQTQTAQATEDTEDSVLADGGAEVAADEVIKHVEPSTFAPTTPPGTDAHHAKVPAQGTALEPPQVEENPQAPWSEHMLAVLSTGASAPLRAAAKRTTQHRDKVALLLAAAAAHTHEGEPEQARALIQEALGYDAEIPAAVPHVTFKVLLPAQYSHVLLPVTNAYGRLWLTAHAAGELDPNIADTDISATADLICSLAQFNARYLADAAVSDHAADTTGALGLLGGAGKRTRVDEWTVLAAHARLLAATGEERVDRGHQLRGMLATWRTTPAAHHLAGGQPDRSAAGHAKPSVVLGTAQMHTDVIAAITGR